MSRQADRGGVFVAQQGYCTSGVVRGTMSLSRVVVSWEAFLVCSAHALSTEKQEIMGILIGSWTEQVSKWRSASSTTTSIDRVSMQAVTPEE